MRKWCGFVCTTIAGPILESCWIMPSHRLWQLWSPTSDLIIPTQCECILRATRKPTYNEECDVNEAWGTGEAGQRGAGLPVVIAGSRRVTPARQVREMAGAWRRSSTCTSVDKWLIASPTPLICVLGKRNCRSFARRRRRRKLFHRTIALIYFR